MKRMGYTMARENMDVDEDLPNFFKTLPVRETTLIIAEHEHIQREYGFEIQDSVYIDKLKSVGWNQKQIQGTPWYNLMSNPKYVEDFSYLGPHLKDRNKLMRDHDHDNSNNY